MSLCLSVTRVSPGPLLIKRVTGNTVQDVFSKGHMQRTASGPPASQSGQRPQPAACSHPDPQSHRGGGAGEEFRVVYDERCTQTVK